MVTKSQSPDTNWAAVEAEFRSGLFSLRQLAARHSVSHVAIKKRAGKEGWEVDLGNKIRVKRQKKLVQAEAAAESIEVALERVADKQVIVIGEHKAAASKARGIIDKLMGELDWGTDHQDIIEECIRLVTNGEPFDQLNLRQAFNRAMSLPARAGTIQRLVNAYATVVDIERKTYGIDDSPPAEKTYEQRLKELIDEGSND